MESRPVQRAFEAIAHRRSYECVAGIKPSPFPDLVETRGQGALRPQPEDREGVRHGEAEDRSGIARQHQIAHAASTNMPLALTRNATPASAPLHKGAPRAAIQTAARCGASISRSDASGIDRRGKIEDEEERQQRRRPKALRAGPTDRARSGTRSSMPAVRKARPPAAAIQPAWARPEQIATGQQRRLIEPDVAVQDLPAEHLRARPPAAASSSAHRMSDVAKPGDRPAGRRAARKRQPVLRQLLALTAAFASRRSSTRRNSVAVNRIGQRELHEALEVAREVADVVALLARASV